MSFPKSKEEYYDRAKALLETRGFTVNPARDIQHGLQFIVFQNGDDGIVRIYQSKKGVKLDLSQVKNDTLLSNIQSSLTPIEMERENLVQFKEKGSLNAGTPKIIKKDPVELIGVDESGKGDYFGPLVISAVYVDADTSKALTDLGITDSKKLSDARIRELAPQIEELTINSTVVMANRSYNQIYAKVQNLNHMLAWGHARAIENVLRQVDCPYALSDQFGNPELIRAKLYSRGHMINLFSRPRAEDNIAVAAASVLARFSFLDYIQEIADKFSTPIPKGASPIVSETAQRLINKHGKDILPFITKLHFKTTDSLDFGDSTPEKGST